MSLLDLGMNVGMPLLAMTSPMGAAAAFGMYNMYGQSRNMRLQKEFAKKGLRWRVHDAQAAGIHPLAALGGATNSPTFGVGGSPMEKMGQQIYRRPPLKRLDSEFQQAELEATRARTGLINAQTLKLMTDKDETVSPYKEPQRTSYKGGVEDYMVAQDMYAVDVDGNADLILTQETSEPAESDLYFQAKRFGREGLRHFKSISGRITKPMPRKAPRENHVWAWNRWQNNWQQVHRRKVKPLRSMKKRTISKRWQRDQAIGRHLKYRR